VKLHFSEEVLHALTATPAERRRRFTDLIQRGLVFDATPSGGYFYFRYTFAGRQRLLGLGKLGTADLGQIRQRVTELTHQLIDGHNPALIQGDRASTPSLGEFYRERYLPHVRTYKTTTINDSCYFVNHLLPFFGEIAMHRISRGEVSRFVSRKLEEGFKPSSINRYLVALRFAFNLALQWEVPGISKNPLHRYQLLKENNLINRFLTVEETLRLKATLADSANPDLASIVGFLLVTGARKTEVLEARWEQFDLGPGIGGTTAAYDSSADALGVISDVAPLDWYAAAGYSYAPSYGKVSLFDHFIGYYDVYTSAGVGAVHAYGETTPAIDLGTGARIFLNRYIGLDLNLRDRLQYRDIASGEPAFVQTLTLGLGVGIFLTPQPTPGAE
jgi:outer membrane beta-barrel protein